MVFQVISWAIISLALSMVIALPRVAIAQGIGVELWADAANSVQGVSFEEKQLQLTTGALGVRLTSKAPVIGEAYIDTGFGYAPDRGASFIGAKVEGDAKLKVLGLGLRRLLALPSKPGLVLALEGRYLYQQLQGDFNGQFGRREVTADMEATLRTSDLEVALFRLMERRHLGFGIGLRLWDVNARANAQLGESIRVNTDADFTDMSVLFSATIMFPVLDRDMTLRYEWTQMPADKSVGINRLTIRWRMKGV